MVNPQKIIAKCLGHKNNTTECWLCGNETDYPQLRYGKELCNRCAEKEDKQDAEAKRRFKK